MHASTVIDGKENWRRQPKPTATDQKRTCSAWGRSSPCSLTGQAVPTASGQGEDRPFSTHSTPSTMLTAPAETQAHQGSCIKLDNWRTGAIVWPLTNAAPRKQAALHQQQGFVWKQSEHHKVVHLFRLVIYPQKWGKISKPLSPLKFSPLPFQAFAYDCTAWSSATQSTFYLGHKNSHLRST